MQNVFKLWTDPDNTHQNDNPFWYSIDIEEKIIAVNI